MEGKRVQFSEKWEEALGFWRLRHNSITMRWIKIEELYGRKHKRRHSCLPLYSFQLTSLSTVSVEFQLSCPLRTYLVFKSNGPKLTKTDEWLFLEESVAKVLICLVWMIQYFPVSLQSYRVSQCLYGLFMVSAYKWLTPSLPLENFLWLETNKWRIVGLGWRNPECGSGVLTKALWKFGVWVV